jgi:hypothetical protein
MRGFVICLCVMEHPVNQKHFRNAVLRIRNILVRIRMWIRIRTVPVPKYSKFENFKIKILARKFLY